MKGIKKVNSTVELFKPWIISLFLLPITIYIAVNSGKFFFIDYVNLLIHEGGHGIFRIFGKFIYTLGGTLAQIIIPGVFVVYYGIHRRRVLLQVFLIWLGQNIINISVYAADARAQKLPLLGGNKVYHDWDFLLNTLGMIQYVSLIGLIFYFLGIVVFLISLLMPLLIKDVQQAKIELDL